MFAGLLAVLSLMLVEPWDAIAATAEGDGGLLDTVELTEDMEDGEAMVSPITTEEYDTSTMVAGQPSILQVKIIQLSFCHYNLY